MTAARNNRRKLARLAMADQVQAATTEAAALLERGAARELGHLRYQDPTRLPWVVALVARRTLGTMTGETWVCPHLSSPRVAFLPSWVPVLACSQCMDAIPQPDAIEDRTCDACRQVVTGIHIALVAAGPWIVLGGLCGPCYRASGAGSAREALGSLRQRRTG